MRRGPSTKHVRRSKAVLCFFDDGLGIAHIRSDDVRNVDGAVVVTRNLTRRFLS